jgi:hypothetical protein
LSVIIVVVSIFDFNYQNLVNPKSGKRKTSDPPNIPCFFPKMTTMTLMLLFLTFLIWMINPSVVLSSDEKCALLRGDHPDRIFKFPGWNQPLPSPWYSGYLDYELEGQHVHTHYTLVVAEESPEDLPLIYWSNGGPGASSLFGLLTEIGPLILSDESLQTDDYRSTDIPTPIYNPYTWTRLGTLLIIDQPAPVGFSYCNNDTTSHSCGGIGWTDELTSLNAYTALQTFFTTKFPCLSSKQLYLTGESYGGIYIPTLARRIVQDTNSTLDLKGFAVGDGCLGTFWKKKHQRNSFTVGLMDLIK